MTKKNTDDPKTRYLNSIRDLVLSLHRRDGLMSRMCPCLQDKPDATDLKVLAKLNRDIATHAKVMSSIEAEANHEFGMVKLLGQDVPVSPAIRNCVAILVSQTATGDSSASDVATLAALSVGRNDTQGLIQVHEAFVRTGILRPHCSVWFRRAAHIGETQPTLKEQAFRTIAGLPVEGGAEFDEIERVSEITGRR